MINVFSLYLSEDLKSKTHYLNMAKVAIYSCVTRTSLRPVVLYNSRLDSEILSWMHDIGVETIKHEVSFADKLRRHYQGKALEFAMGTYMRCDIPLLFPDEERVLYTDSDVVFKQDPVKNLNFDIKGNALGMSSEIGPVPGGYCTSDWMYNSGVMLFNVAWFRENNIDFGSFGEAKGWKFDGFDKTVFSQGLINNMFSSRTYQLPAEFNWRPYQGKNKHQIITHYHMFKPDHWNQDVTDYLLRTSYINDAIINSVLDFAGENIRESVREFIKIKKNSEVAIKPDFGSNQYNNMNAAEVKNNSWRLLKRIQRHLRRITNALTKGKSQCANR
jgi:lipopolysaccharide biosynthesis glycosyltransferase